MQSSTRSSQDRPPPLGSTSPASSSLGSLSPIITHPTIPSSQQDQQQQSLLPQAHHQAEGEPSTSGKSWRTDTTKFRIQGWDPLLIVSQILAIQAIHYLLMALLVPLMLAILSSSSASSWALLEAEGGAKNVAMIIDWRPMVGRSTLTPLHPDDPRAGAGFGRLPAALGRKPSHRPPPLPRQLPSSNSNSSLALQLERLPKNFDIGFDASDPSRSWAISIAWLLSSLIGVLVLYEIVRRPKHIMDHALTTSMNHVILSTYYSARVPTASWFYIVLLLSAVVQIVLAEQLCVKREFRDGLGLAWKVDHRPDPS